MRLCVTALAAVLCLAAVAHAQAKSAVTPADDVEAAKAHFAAGSAYYDQANYADAVKVVRLLLERRDFLAPAAKGVLNVNIPALPVGDMAGFAVATLGRVGRRLVAATDPGTAQRARAAYGGASADPRSDCLRTRRADRSRGR